MRGYVRKLRSSMPFASCTRAPACVPRRCTALWTASRPAPQRRQRATPQRRRAAALSVPGQPAADARPGGTPPLGGNAAAAAPAPGAASSARAASAKPAAASLVALCVSVGARGDASREGRACVRRPSCSSTCHARGVGTPGSGSSPLASTRAASSHARHDAGTSVPTPAASPCSSASAAGLRRICGVLRTTRGALGCKSSPKHVCGPPPPSASIAVVPSGLTMSSTIRVKAATSSGAAAEQAAVRLARRCAAKTPGRGARDAYRASRGAAARAGRTGLASLGQGRGQGVRAIRDASRRSSSRRVH